MNEINDKSLLKFIAALDKPPHDGMSASQFVRESDRFKEWAKTAAPSNDDAASRSLYRNLGNILYERDLGRSNGHDLYAVWVSYENVLISFRVIVDNDSELGKQFGPPEFASVQVDCHAYWKEAYA